MKVNQQPTTKHDVTKAVEELAEITNRAFENVEKRMATKDDLAKTEHRIEHRLDNVDQRFDNVEHRLDNVEQRMATKDDIKQLDSKVTRIENSQQAVLSVLQDIDTHFREQKDIPERMARLERRIFR